ncbi:MAG: alpha/beta hydrolase [Rhodospirillaceae bacterium]
MTEKTPLLLLPGLLCDRALWGHQLDTLTDLAEMTVGDMTLDDTVDGMAVRNIARMPDKFALAGLSMGGYSAQAVMRLAPERVTKLALLDTSARSDTPDRIQGRRDLIARAAAGEFKEVVERHLPVYLPPERLTEEPLVNAVRQSAYIVGEAAYQRQQTALINRPDNRTNLSAIGCPTLVLCGRQDRATTLEMHEEMATEIPNAALVVIEDCAHLSPLEQPHAVSAAMRYWLNI